MKIGTSSGNDFKKNFRFLNAQLNRTFIQTMLMTGTPFRLDENDVVFYNDDAAVEGIVKRVRKTKFDDWKVISCPENMVNKYRLAMILYSVDFVEESSNGKIEFLISSKHDPQQYVHG